MRDHHPAGVRRLPFTGAAIAGAIMMIVGIALPAQSTPARYTAAHGGRTGEWPEF